MPATLITGGAGFLGSEFVRQTLELGDETAVVLDALTYAGDRDNLPAEGDRLVFAQGDIADRPLVERLLREHGVTRIVNFAAESHVDRSIDDPGAFLRTNVLGVYELLTAALGHWRRLAGAEREAFRFVQVSTDEVYGSLGATGEFTEGSPYAPRSPYAASKAAGDHFVRSFHTTYGLPTIVTNGSNCYGPRQFPEKLVPLLAMKAMRGERLPIYGDGSNVREWLHTADACRAIRAVVEKGRPGESYNVGGGAERTNLEVARQVCRLVEKHFSEAPVKPVESLIELVADRPGHDFRYAVDATKLRSELGWTPEIGFDEGLDETVRWCVENLAWTERALQRAGYDGGRLGRGE
ncbi:dTDP-glucose 4,6-dehydratase 2 [Pseudobythopirellula maris]|uniref:dTDP-glucose 4,6-dehydratase n=1 Tax=Pseudobythopirellula maris TaxID=2527991 RepID=A0A5C5ZUE8_9BACT|nr:dTDP-glucose 4,6-dehydratase [Pseudobythopirellula maris]TWT90870.1 dTDP-glucose 4,6-dehydratase 2 [Pseudobythopirellula maris]